MEGFRSAAGQLHMLFADEDEYYTDSLVRMDREAYIDYCLQRAGYQGIYFVEKQLAGKGGYVVMMGSTASAELYCYQDPSAGVSLFFGKKSALRETEGKRVLCRHTTSEEVTGRILYMLKNQDHSSLAFVMSPEVFAELYQESTAREAVRKMLEVVKNSIFLLVSSMKADESFPVFTEKKEIFGETFFRELQKLSRAGGHFRLYEELKNELGECFHLWNQMKRQELYKLLQYLWLTEKNWQKVSTERLEEGADFLCRWYHQPELETPPGLRLPEKSHRSMKELRNYLKNQAENFMEQAFDRETERTRQCQEKPWYPAFAETADVRRLKQGIEEIAGQEKRKVQLKLSRVTEIMTCPWSDFKKLERPGLQEMLKRMEEMKEENCRSSETAERMLDYLYYSFRSEGHYDSDDIYQMKCDCYREIVRCTCTVARLEKINRKYQKNIEKKQKELEERRKHFKKKCEQDPIYLAILQKMKAGTLEPGVATEYRMEISQEKGALVQLQKNIQQEKQYMISGLEEITVRKNSIEKLDLVLKELITEKNTEVLSSILKRAGVMLHEQNNLEQEAWKTLKKASSLLEKEEDVLLDDLLKEEKKTEETDTEVWYV